MIQTLGHVFRRTTSAVRTRLEYALGASIAIAAARLADGLVEDDWQFFNENTYLHCEDLLRILKSQASGEPASLRESAERLSIGEPDVWEF